MGENARSGVRGERIQSQSNLGKKRFLSGKIRGLKKEEDRLMWDLIQGSGAALEDTGKGASCRSEMGRHGVRDGRRNRRKPF